MANNKRLVCPQCGTVLDVASIEGNTGSDWLECSTPTGFEWTLPAGRLDPVVGDAIFIDAFGKQWTRGTYMKHYGLDPEIAWSKMKKWREEHSHRQQGEI